MLLIKNCKILTEGKVLERNILCDNSGKIKEVAVDSLLKHADEILDAKGKFAIPGVIDVHVHCREPGLTHKEDFSTASKAAAAGGVTTFVDMPNSRPATTTVALINEKRKLAAEKSIVNFGINIGATQNNIDEVRNAKNIAGVKVYMGSSTGDLLVTDDAVLNEIFKSGKLVAVHAENEDLIKENTELFKTSSDYPTALHLKIRNNLAAAKAVERAIYLGKQHNTQLHICHVSTKEEVALIAAAKKEYAKLSCEVTPHHLFLTAEIAKKLGTYGKVNPPLRSKQDVAALWESITKGEIDMIATDHAPHTRDEKEQDYWSAPSGMPGVQTMLPLMLNSVNKGKISLQQLIALTSENPATVFGMAKKGVIAQGYDGDITIIDIHKEKIIKNRDMLSKCGWTPFDGSKVRGVVTATIVNGNIIFSNGEIIDEKSRGREVMFK
jgi:dihydroorotase